jgi:NADH:ubiquinone oxidoreductase subunit 6 (subunit J)
MLAGVLILVLVLAAIALVLFVAMVVGMRNEPTYDELSTRPPSPLASLTRRMLGVSVRKPATQQATANTEKPREPWFAGAGYTPTNRDDEGR